MKDLSCILAYVPLFHISKKWPFVKKKISLIFVSPDLKHHPVASSSSNKSHLHAGLEGPKQSAFLSDLWPSPVICSVESKYMCLLVPKIYQLIPILGSFQQALLLSKMFLEVKTFPNSSFLYPQNPEY